jgi:hypothetical protein
MMKDNVLRWPCLIVGFVVLILMANSFANFMINNTTTHTEEYTLDTKIPIASLSDAMGTKGSFILGSGSVSNELVFTYYVGTTSFQLKQVPAEYTTIYMDENISPYLLARVYMKRNLNRDNVTLSETRLWYMATEYEFHVPSGTIVKQYNLNGG